MRHACAPALVRARRSRNAGLADSTASRVTVRRCTCKTCRRSSSACDACRQVPLRPPAHVRTAPLSCGLIGNSLSTIRPCVVVRALAHVTQRFALHNAAGAAWERRVVQRGDANRIVAATKMNAQSSRLVPLGPHPHAPHLPVRLSLKLSLRTPRARASSQRTSSRSHVSRRAKPIG